jgi:hypothetical protein
VESTPWNSCTLPKCTCSAPDPPCAVPTWRPRHAVIAAAVCHAQGAAWSQKGGWLERNWCSATEAHEWRGAARTHQGGQTAPGRPCHVVSAVGLRQAGKARPGLQPKPGAGPGPQQGEWIALSSCKEGRSLQSNQMTVSDQGDCWKKARQQGINQCSINLERAAGEDLILTWARHWEITQQQAPAVGGAAPSQRAAATRRCCGAASGRRQASLVAVISTVDRASPPVRAGAVHVRHPRQPAFLSRAPGATGVRCRAGPGRKRSTDHARQTQGRRGWCHTDSNA